MKKNYHETKLMSPRDLLFCTFCIFWIFALVSTTAATYITLSSSVAVCDIISGNETRINITTTNFGDEPAHDVRLSLLLPDGFMSESIMFGRVDANEKRSGSFVVSIDPDVLPGGYPVILLTDYKDANAYPFSAVSTDNCYMFIKKKTSSNIYGRIPEVSLTGTVPGGFDIEVFNGNLDDTEQEIHVRLFTPRELRLNPGGGANARESILLNAGESRKLSYEISSFGALPGSTYAILATLDYAEDDLHYSSFCVGKVSVDGGPGAVGTGGAPGGENDNGGSAGTKPQNQVVMLMYVILAISILVIFFSFIFPKLKR